VKIVACDPGLNGAIAYVNSENEESCAVWDMPVCQKMVDPEAIKFLLGPYDFSLVIMEKPQWRHGLGAKSICTTWFNYGRLTSCFTFYGEVEAQSWKKELGLSKDKKKSLEMARGLYPSLGDFLKRVKDADRAEALLIAYWFVRSQNESKDSIFRSKHSTHGQAVGH